MPTLPSITEMLKGALPEPEHPTRRESNPARLPPLEWRSLQDGRNDGSWASSNTAPSTTRSSPTRADYNLEDIFGELQNRLGSSNIDIASIRQTLHQELHGPIRPAYDQGWYQPNDPENKFRSKLEARIEGMNRNELVSVFFTRNSTRATYGDRVVIPRRPHDKQSSQSPVVEGAKKPHAVLEQERRERHRDFQNQSCTRSPDIAAECGGEHADESKEARTQRAKGPGKDEQLCTAIYSQELSGRVVQSEHDGRSRAEKLIWILLDFLEASLSKNNVLPTATAQRGTLGLGSVSRKRTLDEINHEDRRTSVALSACESDDEYQRSQSTASSPWKRYRSHCHFHGSSSTLRSLPPSPPPSLEENEGRSSSVPQTGTDIFDMTR
ncbi:hypothetical protein LTR84_010282 [Exophiala bonariae]|uniref:Uncharacterized protein n=1 Tax=Exophiala bonariae TaxID=1690606 RepID=A0AAV9MTW7_9EURO|nr:hypothetical protein LTR84_010282 [Exophiala bonariae]